MQGCVAHANCPGDPRALPPVYRSGQRFSGQAEVCEPCLCLTCHSHWLLLTFQVKEASDNQNKEAGEEVSFTPGTLMLSFPWE